MSSNEEAEQLKKKRKVVRLFPSLPTLTHTKKTFQASTGPARASRVVRFGGKPGPSRFHDPSRGRNSTGRRGWGAVVVVIFTSSLGVTPAFFPSSPSSFLLARLFFPSPPAPVAPRRRRGLRSGRLALRFRLQAPRTRAAGREGEPAAGRPRAAAEVGEGSLLFFFSG